MPTPRRCGASVLARRCAAVVQQKADETLWRAQLDVWLSNFRGQSFATRESLQMTDLPLARASTEDAVVHRPLGVRSVYYIIAYRCSCIIYSYRSAVLQISTIARRWPLLSHALGIVCGGNLRLVSTAWCIMLKRAGECVRITEYAFENTCHATAVGEILKARIQYKLYTICV